MNEPIKTTEIRLPIYWASYLVNGDASGLEENEETTIQETLEWAELTDHECIDVKEDISFEYSDIPGLLSGDFCTYIFIKHEKN
tara:strand:- start:488 stop:739 length:252 start_codon:yes stop_codon:yes gene_type:complete